MEQWTIVNESGGWFHPVHIHLIDGKIIGRNTNGGKPFAWENGPKDVFYAGENESVTVLMQFDTGKHEGGRYMIHCHNLVHEDHDMMVQFSIGDLRNNDPITTDPPVRDPLPADHFRPVYRPDFRPGPDAEGHADALARVRRGPCRRRPAPAPAEYQSTVVVTTTRRPSSRASMAVAAATAPPALRTVAPMAATFCRIPLSALTSETARKRSGAVTSPAASRRPRPSSSSRRAVASCSGCCGTATSGTPE